MSQTAIFTQPIKGELSSDGRLLKADSQLLSLHFAAGGEEGGIVAVPSLLAISRQTARLKIGLARKVIVADIDGCHELWVETHPDRDIVQLSILSMRPIDADADEDKRLTDIDTLGGFFGFDINSDQRVIALHGAFPTEFDFLNIGKSLTDTIIFTEEVAQDWQAAFAGESAFSCDSVGITDIAGRYSFSARPVFAPDGKLTGYRVDVIPAKSPPAAQQTVMSDTISGENDRFFGQKLAPALRQPLGRIIANAETIGAKLNGPLRDNYAVYAKDISDAAKHLVSLVDDLGDLEAVERSGFDTAKERVDLGDAAQRISGLLALKAADHQISISLPNEEDNVTATAEFRRVLQILLNLVNNAIRYSPDGTEIRIDTAQLGQSVCITVSDEGAGIAEEDREKIFEKFERLGRSGDGGSGLGLYISRRLARAMGGDLLINDSSTGGACFALTLPAAD